MTIFIHNTLAVANCDTIVDSLDAGAGSGLLNIYAGSIPADAHAALGGATLLGTPVFADPAFGNAVDNTGQATATANAIADDTDADATGPATFFRATDSDGNVKFQGSAGDVGTEDLVLNSADIQENAKVEVISLTFSVPE